MRWIDGHLDLAYLAENGADIGAEPPDPAKRCVSLPALRQAGVELCFATIFTEPGEQVAGKKRRTGAVWLAPVNDHRQEIIDVDLPV